VDPGNASVRLEAALAGLGVARITSTFCAAAVAEGRLVPVLAGWECEPLRMFALLPGRRLAPAKVRAFLDGLEVQAA
jgi:DNA-binding transcriptional LysR family regulator